MSKFSKYNRWKPLKKRPAAQMQVTALMKSHTTYQHAQNKENIAPLATTSSPASAISNTRLEREKKRKNTYQSRYRNEKQCHERTKSRTNKLQSHLDEARASMTEASSQVQTTQNALTTTQHEMRHLQACNEVLTRHNRALAIVQDIICTVASCLRKTVDSSISTRSIRRVVQEAEVAAEVQMVDEIMQVDGVTLSGDGMSHKNINYQSHHITYTSRHGAGITRFAGIQHKVNHTSETQLQGWKDMIHKMCTVYNECMVGNMADPRELVTKVKMTDGAIVTVGGIEGWEALPAEERDRRSSEAQVQLHAKIGQERFSMLTTAEQESIDFFVWGGCCMHKDLNAVKGGNTRMRAWWALNDVDGPALLMNRDNAAAASGGPSTAQARAVRVSQGGAAKALALAGSVFHHKDDKKGQQDSLRFFLEAQLGYFSPWPDTSNTHYHSNCDGAGEWIVHEDLYIVYLQIIMDRKDARTHTNIEQNIYCAFRCDKTKQEMACFSTWGQCISHPYFRAVCNSLGNILDLGPLHEQLIAHIKKLIDNVELVFGTDTTYETAAFDGQPFEWPEAFYIIQCIARNTTKYPHLCSLFVAFLEGALETLIRFCREFAANGVIAHTSPETRKLARMNTTNDANKGMYMKTVLGPNARKYLRKKARINDAAGAEKKHRLAQVKYDNWVVHRNREIDAKRKKHREASSAKLAAVVPRVTPDEIAKMRVVDVDLQIRWHRQFDVEVPPAKHLKGKNGPEKKAILTAAVGRYVCGGVGPKILDENVMDGQQEDAECAMGDSDDEEGL
ncbi:hypothetical protein DEU56DRAFT_755013 [Suillus clintonianus]|uniref:uncharacterized protein n=1 Tax=Suillus clintonianus TaxID=1904413 RepID=UPI001B878A1B|nr:uncharacterized protein DEU56DRAFT_755013 [Suillus clintonianus]KAG2141308.1 hypothetical protein DEU56DRAFT_755013 [Suillus clintonianus]